MADVLQTPLSNATAADDVLPQAPKKRKSVGLTAYLERGVGEMQFEWRLTDGRVGGYLYQPGYGVYLYNMEAGDVFSPDDGLYVFFPAEDWKLFREQICRDLMEAGEDPVYCVQWNSTVDKKTYRVEADRLTKPDDDFVYFRFCEDNTEMLLAPYGQAFPPSVKKLNDWFELRVLYLWKDWPMVVDAFTKIDALFKWANACKRYNEIKIKLFREDELGCDCGVVYFESPPTIYRHV